LITFAALPLNVLAVTPTTPPVGVSSMVFFNDYLNEASFYSASKISLRFRNLSAFRIAASLIVGGGRNTPSLVNDDGNGL
jgi:hypothetical protein